MVIFPVKLLQETAEVGAYLAHHMLHFLQMCPVKYLPPVFSDKHQVDVQVINAVPASANVAFIFHTPSVTSGT